MPAVRSRAQERALPNSTLAAPALVDALADSPLHILDSRSALRLVTDLVPKADALFVALACRVLKDCMFLRGDFAEKQMHDGKLWRFLTPDSAVVCSVGRLEWALSLPEQPGWASEREPKDPDVGPLIGNYRTSQSDVYLSVCDRIAKAGELKTLKWASSNKFMFQTVSWRWSGESTCIAAAKNGRLEVLQWLVTQIPGYGTCTCAKCRDGTTCHGAEIDGTVINCAARCGHLEVVKWLCETTCGTSAGCVCRLDEYNWGVDERTCAAAANGGQLEVLQYLRGNLSRGICNGAWEEKCAWDERTCLEAAKGGHLELLKWARANGCPWGNDAMDWAARNGHLEVVKWCHGDGLGIPLHPVTCRWAAVGGRLEILQWVRAKGADWDEGTCWCAARHGHLQTLQWARENGCPWDRAECLQNARTEEVLAWIDSQVP